MNVSVVGIGRLGLCMALSLEKKGYNVTGVDVNSSYVFSLQNKMFVSDEPGVNELLENSEVIFTTDLNKAVENDTIFLVVATPSLPNGDYDHSQIETLVDNLVSLGTMEKNRHLVICCTTMPGFCDTISEKLSKYNWTVSYNPEFIAQGTVLRDQANPDMILIGHDDHEKAAHLKNIYLDIVENVPRFCLMSRKEAEITKIALNCFLTTKIAYANMVGDSAIAAGCNPDVILSAIGSDSRIGNKYLKYGYGFGGPCFPRDNKAFGNFAQNVKVDPIISRATDKSNEHHLEQQLEQKLGSKEEKFVFETVTYKPESTMLVESQQLKLALMLADRGVEVTILEREAVIQQLKEMHGEKFTYKTIN